MEEDTKHFLSNASIDESVTAKINSMLSPGEKLLFVIKGDLNLKSKYDTVYFAAGSEAIYRIDDTAALDGKIKSIPYGEIRESAVKRYYGNAMLVIKSENDISTDFVRFSYRVASLFDAAAIFVQRIARGGNLDEEYGIMEAAFEKALAVCQKCGRNLLRPGADCIYCQSKSKLIKKIGVYILPHTKALVFGLILSGITTSMSLLPPFMTKMLVDDVIPNRNLNKLVIVVLVLLASYLIQQGVGTVRAYVMRVCGDNIVKELRSDVYRKAQYLPMRFYDRTSTGSVINRISGDTSTLQAFMMRITQEVVIQFFTLIGIIIIMISLNWRLTLLSLIPVPFVVAGAKIFGEKIRPFYRKIWRRWSAVTSILTDTLPGIRVIKSFTSEKTAIDDFDDYNKEWLKVDLKSAKITILFPHIVSFVITCGSLLIWGVGGSLSISNPEFISTGLLVSFISYTSMFYGPVNFFANLNDSYQHALAAAERILDIIDAEPEDDFGKGVKGGKLKGKIEFKNVNFSFDRSKKTLSNINFVINPGDIVGIVGTTGSGKSTLINLLMRFYDGYDGEILVDNKDIRTLDMEYYRGEIGYVQQEPMMFHDTIYNNISFGSPGAHVEQVMHAADVANAHEFIARMPDAYDTVLGERGTGLSGGEKQRLSIARAVLKNPSVLFFDEATAAVDSETEALIQSAIERLISGRTTLMIAHRLSTLRKANKIIVVDNGEILEMGSPEELMAKKGKYYKLVQIQTMSDELNANRKAENFG